MSGSVAKALHLCPRLPGIAATSDTAQGAGQLPQHQQRLHGHAAPHGATAATAPTGTTAGAAGSSQASGSGSGQQATGGGSSAAGNGVGSSGQGSSGGQGGGDGNEPNRSGQGGTGHAAGSSGQSTQQQQQSASQQQNAQPGQMPMSGAWAAANYGYVWNMPQWVPATSMALFAPAMGYHPMQYAGQTNPASVAPELQVRPGTACCS